MAETFRYRDSKWHEARDAEFELTERWGVQQDTWCAEHPSMCPECGRPYSVHKEPSDCERFSAEGYAKDLGWDAGQRGHIKANPYCHDDPDEAALWKIYEDRYQKGAIFKEEHNG